MNNSVFEAMAGKGKVGKEDFKGVGITGPKTSPVDQEVSQDALKGLEAKKEPLENPDIPKSDLDLAEKMIFEGYVKIDVTPPSMPNMVFTIATLTAEEVNMVDEMVFSYLKENDQNVSQTMVDSFRSLCYTALSYQGMNKRELCDTNIASQLRTLKTAILKLNEYVSNGEIDKVSVIKEEIKKQLKARVMAVRKMAPTVIDFLLNERYKLDTKMNDLMTIKGVIPKS